MAIKETREIPIPEEIREKWQNTVNILMRIMRVPVALITKVEAAQLTVLQSSDSPENPFKAGHSFRLNTNLYCETTMVHRKKLFIPNALKDPLWAGNPSAAAGIIAYLGFPVFYPDGEVFGTLCVLDKKENNFSDDLEEVMLQFKEIVESHLKLIWQGERLRERMVTVEKMNKMLVGRELRIIELKKKVAELEKGVCSPDAKDPRDG